MLNKIIRFFLDNKPVAVLFLSIIILWGISTAPFHWNTGNLPRDPVPVDAIPNIGDNQQIVSTEWMGRSPQNVQDQITYPLSTALLGISGVKSVRSTSMFGMSFIYLIFDDKTDYYWSRSRITEKLSSLPAGTLPPGVQPSLGPDATALGQIYWYTLEGRDPKTGKPAGGWDPQELRTIQDYYIRYGLTSTEGVAEVSSVGGYIREYQVDINPEAMKSYGINVMQVMKAVQNSNLDIGAQTIELNKVEYVIRGLGYIKNIADLEKAVVAVNNNTPVRIKDIARVSFGPADRRGGLDKNGSEAVGGVVVARYGANPMAVIHNVKDKIKEISDGLPSRKLADGSVSKVTIVPFYDRSGLIQETLGTLEDALTHEILISILVIILLVMNLRASLLVSGLLPIAVLMTFIFMRYLGVEANIVALSGIAIAIGVMVDVGIILVENILRHLELSQNQSPAKSQLKDIIYQASTEVSGAVVTALATTIVSFLPVFAMQAAEGKLFIPLAITKTLALISSLILGIVLIPVLAQLVFGIRLNQRKLKTFWNFACMIIGIFLALYYHNWIAVFISLFGLNNILSSNWPQKYNHLPERINMILAALAAGILLTRAWLPLGAQNSGFSNFVFVTAILGSILGCLGLMIRYYEKVLSWCLLHKKTFLLIPVLTLFLGILSWQGFDKLFKGGGKWIEKSGWPIRSTNFWKVSSNTFPGMGKEFMPSLDEGSFLLMPTTMPHTGVEENIRIISSIDSRLAAIPEVELVAGKWGRVNSALDPAPTTMFENIINYIPEYVLNEDGRRERFKTDASGRFELILEKVKNEMADTNTPSWNRIQALYWDPNKDSLMVRIKDKWQSAEYCLQAKEILDIRRNIHLFLQPDDHGSYFRQWRDHIHKPDDIWKEILRATAYPGMTSSPRLQPIETRLIMLSTGMRAPMGIKVTGPDAETIEAFSVELEKCLREVPAIATNSVFAERNVGSPYLEIQPDRDAMARYGLSVTDIQEVLQSALGGMTLSTSVEGRERFPIRVRYARELRNTPGEIGNILIPGMGGAQIPLNQLASINYRKGPQMIRSENTFLTNYIIFDKEPGKAEVDVVESADSYLKSKIKEGKLKLPNGVSYHFAGTYEQEIRATQRLALVIPISLFAIFLILFFQFRTITASFIHFSGVVVAFSGGFILLWLYGQPWFMNFSLGGISMRDMFQMHSVHLSVAVWVGFIALFGIATNDGVIMGTYIHQVFEHEKPTTIEAVRKAVIHAGKKRVRPAMMTAAIAIIALLPVLTSSGKGSDIMVPMAIPTFGGMVIQIMTMLVVPVLQSLWRENAIRKQLKKEELK